MRKKVTVQIMDQALSGKDSFSLINFLTKFKRACDSSSIREGAAAWLSREFKSGFVLAAIRALMALSSNDLIRPEGATTSYAEMANHLLTRYATNDVIAKAREES